MKLIDANVLLYAVDGDAPHHAAAKEWLDTALAGTETLLLPWISLLAFVRLSTHPRVYEHPLTPDQAWGVVDGWLDAPHVITPEPDGQHTRRIAELLRGAGGHGGNLVNDAHLAALAVQHGATMVTFDSDFGRFPEVRWETPGRA